MTIYSLDEVYTDNDEDQTPGYGWDCEECYPFFCSCLFECTVCGSRSEPVPNFCGCAL